MNFNTDIFLYYLCFSLSLIYTQMLEHDWRTHSIPYGNYCNYSYAVWFSAKLEIKLNYSTSCFIFFEFFFIFFFDFCLKGICLKFFIYQFKHETKADT